MTKWIESGDVLNDQFYKFPKSFIYNEKYAKLPSTAMIVYAVLRDRLALSLKNGYWDEDGRAFVYFSQENLAELFHMTRQSIANAIKALQEVDLVETKRQGFNKPNKIYIAMPEPFTPKCEVEADGILHPDVKKTLHPYAKKILHPDANNFYTSKTDISKTEINKNNILSGKPDLTSFVHEVVSYLNEKAGTKYRDTSEKTKKLVVARWREGWREKEFRAVIDTKCADWLRNPDMAKYLRPETLFGTKFESYLNESIQFEKKRRAEYMKHRESGRWVTG